MLLIETAEKPAGFAQVTQLAVPASRLNDELSIHLPSGISFSGINAGNLDVVLALLVEQELGRNPFSGVLYAFTNRQRNKIKYVIWEDNGFVMYYKAFAEEKFKWPKPADELLALTGE